MVHSRIEELKQKWFWYWSRAYISWLPHRRCNISMFCVSQFKSFNIYMYLCNVSFNTDASFVLWLYCVCEEKTHRLHMLSSHRVSWNLEKFLKICSNTKMPTTDHAVCGWWQGSVESTQFITCTNHSYSCPFQLNASTPMISYHLHIILKFTDHLKQNVQSDIISDFCKTMWTCLTVSVTLQFSH